MKAARYLIFSLFILALSAYGFGQTASTASVAGEVKDANGAVVAGAVVKLVSKATSAEKTTSTNNAGRYVFAAVEPGDYDLTISAQGFRTSVTTGIKAEVTKVATFDVSLQIGAAAEQVTVTAVGEAQLQTADSAIGNVIDADRIKRLPTANRQATDLLRLQPLVAPGGEVSGSRADQNTYTLDGIDVTDQVGFRGAFFTVVPTPTESVEEFRSTVANPNATFGRSAGAQTTLVTKRGSNAFHGSVYNYHQNDNLNANSWTNNQRGIAKPPLIENRFGASLGGPVWKDKLFFFGNYEGRRVPGSTTITRVVPTQSFRDGQLWFSDSADNVVTIDPKTFDPRGLGANPAILSYLKKLPLPNASGFGDGLNTGGFSANIPTTTQDDYGVLRLDYQINEKWSLEAKGALFRSIQVAAGQVNLLELKGGVNTSQRPKNLTFGLTGTIGPNFVNELRIGHSFDNFVQKVIAPSGAPSGFNIAVNLAQTAQEFNPALALLDEAIDVDTQRAREQSLSGGTWQFIDNATWTKGAHTVQFGGNMRRISTFTFRNDKVIGSVAFPVADIGTAGNTPVAATERPPTCGGGVTANCLQAADVNRYNQFYKSLLGIVDNVSYLAVRDADLKPTPIGTGLVNNAVLRHWEFYAGDIWKLRPNLTVSYGMRYQWHTPPIDELGRQTLLAYKDTGELIDPQDYLRRKAAAAANGDIFNPDISYLPIKDAPQEGVFRINRKDFSPRASVAWEPRFNGGPFGFLFGENKSVVRGGYSLIYDRVNTISSVVVPMLGVGFAQTLSVIRPLNSAGQPFRAGVDPGPIPVAVNTAATPPVVPAKPFGETLSFTMDPGIKDPYNHAINFSIQRELPGRMLLEIGYVGRFARNLYQNVNLNSAPIFFKDKASGQTFAQAFDAVAAELRGGTPPAAVKTQLWFQNQLGAALGPAATQVLAAQQTAGFTGGNINNLWNTFMDFAAPQSFNNQQSLDLFVRTSLGRSNYNAMAVTLHQRLARGLTFDVNYTLGKSLDQIGQIQNNVGQFSSSFDGDIDYGPSDFDFRHIFNANGVYDLPFGKGRFSAGKYLNKVIGGWHVSGIYQAFSGAPLTVVQGTQVYGAGLIFGASTGAIPNGRLGLDNSIKSGVTGTGGVGTGGNVTPTNRGTELNIFSNPEQVSKSFRPIRLAEDGRHGRGALRGLSRWQFDLSVGKTTTITERVRFGLQFDFFNVFNKVNFLDPTLDMRNPATFGVISTQLTPANNVAGFRPRVIQIGARVEF